MNQGMQDDFKRDGFISQLMTRLARLEAFEREFRLKKFGSSDLTLVQDTLLAAPAASFDFNTLPTTGKHLHLKLYLRSARVATFDNVAVRYNGDAGANYDYFTRVANAAADSGADLFGQTLALLTYCAAANSTAGLFSTAEVFINNYNETTGNKKGQGRGEDEELASANNYWFYDIAHRWASNNAITSLSVFSGTGSNFDTGSRATLYALM